MIEQMCSDAHSITLTKFVHLLSRLINFKYDFMIEVSACKTHKYIMFMFAVDTLYGAKFELNPSVIILKSRCKW